MTRTTITNWPRRTFSTGLEDDHVVTIQSESPTSFQYRKHVGITLIELLVVISIIGLVLGLLLPAVQAARETARRGACSNNLKQVGIALLQFHDAFRRFPPGAELHDSERWAGISWRVSILPYLEQSAIYSKVHPTSDGGAADWGPNYIAINTLLCPSGPRSPDNPLVLKESHYMGIAGAGRASKRISLEQFSCGDVFIDGMLFPKSHVRISDIEDGTSHTLAVGERMYMLFDWMTGATWKGRPKTRICMGASAANIRYPINADVTRFGYYVSDPDAPKGATASILQNDLFFGSFHGNGAQFCFADGSVHMLSDSVDFTAFEDLATIAGREVDHLDY